jgi:DNA-binding MarR family transcriptional regulator
VTREASQPLHALLMDLVRVTGLLQADQHFPDLSVPFSHAFAVHELDHSAPLSQQELADRLMLEKSTVSRMVADLEQKGLVERERDPANRRTYRLRLTDKGRMFHAHIADVYGGRFHQWIAALTDAERDALLVGLPALIRAVRGR